METRRIRRQERRRVYRTGLLAISVAVLGVALGMTLPDNRIAFFALLGVAACCVVIVVVRDERRAPLHGLHQVVRLPLRTSVRTTCASFAARVAGTVRSLFGTRPPTPIVLDEPDDEAAAWWGPTAIAAPVPVPVPAASAVTAPAVPLGAEVPEPTYASIALVQPEPTAPVPVLAAPIATAHVPADPSVTVKVRVSLKVAAARRHLQPLARKVKLKRAHEETQVPAST